jgi:hypothetical protein
VRGIVRKVTSAGRKRDECIFWFVETVLVRKVREL